MWCYFSKHPKPGKWEYQGSINTFVVEGVGCDKESTGFQIAKQLSFSV
jgi:hypothetical protein